MSYKDNAKKAIPHLMLVLKTLATQESTLALSGDILLAALLKRKGTGKVRYTDTIEFVATEQTTNVEREKVFLLETVKGLGFEAISNAEGNLITLKKEGDTQPLAYISLRTDIIFKNEGNEKLFSYSVRHLSIEEEMAYLVYLLSSNTASSCSVVNYYLYLEMGYTLPSIKIKLFLDKHKLTLGDFSILNNPLVLEDNYDGLEDEDVIRMKVKEGLSKLIATSTLITSPPNNVASIETSTEEKPSEKNMKSGVFQLNHRAVSEEGKPIPAEIRNRILELADIVQPWGQDGRKIVNFLKVLKNRGDSQNIIYYRFWEDVSAAFFGKTNYHEVELYTHYESKFRKNTDPFFRIHRATRTDNGFFTWMRLNRRYFDFIQPTLDAVYDIKESVGRNTSIESTVYTDEALRFIYNKAGEIKTEKEFFSILPLIQWAIENLLVSKKDNLIRHKDAITKIFIHGMLKHANAVNQLLALLYEVDAYLLAPSEPSQHKWNESNVFVNSKTKKEEEQTEKVKEQFSPVPMAEACSFVQVLARVLEGADTREMPIETFKGEFRRTPFVFIFRYLTVAKFLGALDNTFFPITKERIDSLYLEQESRQALFAEENIEAQILSLILILEAEEDYNLELWTPENLTDLKKQALRAAEVMCICKLISNETFSGLVTKINLLINVIRERIEVYTREMAESLD